MSHRILVADDEQVLRVNLCEFLERAGYFVEGVADGAAALRRVREEEFALVITDIRMPGLDGISLLKRIVLERPETHVLVTTAYASLETAVEAFRFGAFDYVVKPVIVEDLLQKVHNLLAYRSLRDEVRRLRHDLQSRLGFEGLVGESDALQEIFKLVERVAPTSSTVVITGESGTGKELIARAVHARSAQRDKEFLAVNMAALPGDLVEAQLFGHERGAFTGAERRREGILRSVNGGTAFLDEIADLPLPSQAKLLRAIESHEVFPIGGDRPIHAEFRLVVATNHDLDVAVREGRFRSDLFFRLNVFRIAVPPLRERREDIPALATHFVDLHCRAQNKRPLLVSNEAMRLLTAYPWPGNVRELSNVIERAAILADGTTIEPLHLPSEFLGTSAPTLDLRSAIETCEKRHISWVLRAAAGNREQAAKLLRVDPATLYRRLAKYEIG